jgi:hypothetical protein
MPVYPGAQGYQARSFDGELGSHFHHGYVFEGRRDGFLTRRGRAIPESGRRASGALEESSFLDESRGLFEREHRIESLTILLGLMRTGNVKTVASRKDPRKTGEHFAYLIARSRSAVWTSERESKNPPCRTKRDKGGAPSCVGVTAGMSSCKSSCRRPFRIQMCRPRPGSGFPGEGYFPVGESSAG